MVTGKAADLANMAKPALDLIGRVRPCIKRIRIRAVVQGLRGPDRPPQRRLQAGGATRGANGQVYKIKVGRDDLKLMEMGAPINARMGLNNMGSLLR